MLDQETKRKIDNARDILVGKVPDPKSQVEQITIALIYKFMDDMDGESEEIGGKAKFFANGFEKYAWGKLMDPKLSGHERLDLYVEAITKMSQNEHLPQLFRDIFKNAFLPFRSPETLNLFLKEINSFSYSHSENLGDSFEYLLSIMGSQGDAGQFRTPRHIIDFIVEVVNPQKHETILDPACGTAGFLISAYKHILKKNKDKLTPDEKQKLMNNLAGYDISPDMVKLSLVNMYLHGFSEPKIFEYDTLSSEDRWDEMYDVIMANPPFMTPKGGIRPHKRFSVQANRSEVLFVDYILEHLNQKGRAGIIVPEGIIFQTANAYKELRRLLIEDRLFAVVSLPAGVFNPYAGVKTSILFFDNALAKKMKDILFFKVINDGFELNAQRRPSKNFPNDLDWIRDAIRGKNFENVYECINKGKNLKKLKWFTAFKQIGRFTIVSKEKIAENGDYNLSGERYGEVETYKKQKWPMVELDEACDIFNGSTPTRSNLKYWQNGNIPWFTIEDVREQGRIITYTKQKITEEALKNTSVKLLPPKTVLLCCTASVGEYAFSQIELTTNQQFNGLVINDKYENKLLPEFLYYLLSTFKKKLIRLSGKTSFNYVSVGTLKKIKIPLPPFEIQKEIVGRIEKKQEIINNAKELISKVERERANSGQIFERLDCEWVELGDDKYFKIESGGTPNSKKAEYWNGKINWVTLVDLPQSNLITEIKNSNRKISELGLKKSSAKLLSINTILVSSRATIGRVGISKLELATNQGFKNIIVKNFKIFNPYFVAYFMTTKVDEMIKMGSGGTYKEISKSNFSKIKIPLIGIKEQEEIISYFDKQSQSIQANQQLIEVFEQQIKDEIGEVWEELL